MENENLSVGENSGFKLTESNAYFKHIRVAVMRKAFGFLSEIKPQVRKHMGRVGILI